MSGNVGAEQMVREKIVGSTGLWQQSLGGGTFKTNWTKNTLPQPTLNANPTPPGQARATTGYSLIIPNTVWSNENHRRAIQHVMNGMKAPCSIEPSDPNNQGSPIQINIDTNTHDNQIVNAALKHRGLIRTP